MTVKECYEFLHGDYSGALSRLRKEALLYKYLKKLPADPCYETLKNAVAENDPKTAFRAAHTMKGVFINLSLDELYTHASEITELLRPLQEIERGGIDFTTTPVPEKLESFSALWKRALDAIELLSAPEA